MDTQLLGNLPRCKITHSCTPHEMPTAILHLYEYLYVYMIREKKNEAISVVHAEGDEGSNFTHSFTQLLRSLTSSFGSRCRGKSCAAPAWTRVQAVASAAC